MADKILRKIMFVVNDPDFFMSHRLALAERAKCEGYEVHIAGRNSPSLTKIKSLGFNYVSVSLGRSSWNPLREAYTVFSLFKAIRLVRPDILHLITIKPVLYGGIVARLLSVPAVVFAITGLGFVYSSKGIKAGAFRLISRFLYRHALKIPNSTVIFQNSFDREIISNLARLGSKSTALIPGSGVDLQIFSHQPEKSGIPVVIFAARLVKGKGVVEFVEAARIIRSRGVCSRFVVLGDIDQGNPEAIAAHTLELWKDEGVVEFLGHRTDMHTLLSGAHVVTLPSYYGEGLPKVLIEASACGRAIVTTDHPGCRDAIDAGRTGLLVPVMDSEALADAISFLIKNPTIRRSMGKAGRILAERIYDINLVVDAHFSIYSKLAGAMTIVEDAD